VGYAICIRKRIEGVAQPWSPAREAARPALVWEGLTPNTIYEVRIRAWDGKASSDWAITERAFRTPTIGDGVGSFIGRSDPSNPESQRTLLVIWPDDATEGSLEAADGLGKWIPCLEIETDGVNNRAHVPMSMDAQFFRVRR
jgi:hypothetical protein